MYELKARSIPENSDYDVIVLGGGPTGCAAAAAAARQGAKTLLIETTGVLGGMGTSGLVPCFAPYGYEKGPEDQGSKYGGIAWEVLTRMAGRMPRYANRPVSVRAYIAIDPEILKKVYDELVEESGADLLFHARACQVDTDGAGSIQAVLVASVDGLTAYRAKVYVDGTGNGLTAVWAGAEAEKGDEHGDMMPATHCFTVGNVNEDAYNYHPDWGWKRGTMHPFNPKSFIHKVVAEGKHPLIEDTFLGDNPIGPQLVGFSAGHIWDVDSTDAASLSRAILRGRKIAWEIFDVTKEESPSSFGGAHMMATANMVGHREGYRVKGDYVLTLDDYADRADFPDAIGCTAFEMDVHRPKDKERAKELEAQLGENAKPQPGSMSIPYRCLTPKGLRNVLVAGRAISCDRLVLGSIRLMPVCMVTGEAAGVAAAMAAKDPSHDVHAVDVTALRATLRENGAVFH